MTSFTRNPLGVAEIVKLAFVVGDDVQGIDPVLQSRFSTPYLEAQICLLHTQPEVASN
jgi:hypothetical protein